MVVDRVLGLMPDYCTYEPITLDNFILGGAATTDQIVLEVMIFFGKLAKLGLTPLWLGAPCGKAWIRQ